MTQSMEASPRTDSDLDTILSELDKPWGKLPEQAIKAARLHKEALIPRLVALIGKAARAVLAGREVKTSGHFFALYLLAEFRAREALPAIVQAISLPDEGPFDLFGDTITEDLSAVLASLADNDPDQITSLVQNKEVNQWVRSAAAGSLVKMFAAGKHPRDEIVQRLRQSFRRAIDEQDFEIISLLVNTLCDLFPEEAYEEIKEAYEKQLVDEFMIRLSDVNYVLQRGRAECIKRLGERPALIDDTVARLQRWASFDEAESPSSATTASDQHSLAKPDYSFPPVTEPVRRSEERVGRNDPCPCGSGKKFKKCCGLK
jgi:hypothetical protein